MRVTEKWRDEISKGLMPDHVVKAFDPRSIEVEANDTARKAAFIVSTGDEDRDGDTVNPNGWKLDAYRKNPIVLWAHDVKSPPIARTEVIAVKGGKLRAETVFPAKGVYPFADTVFGLVQGGFLKGTSVGFHPIEAKPRGKSKGVAFDVQELYEFSILPVPSNRDALVEAKSAGFDVAPVVKWAEMFLDRAQESGLWVPRFQIEKALKAILPLTVTVPAMPSERQDVESEGHAIAGAALSDDEVKGFVDAVEKGDLPGHPFRGNQYTDGGGDGGDDDGERPTLYSSTGALAYDFGKGEARARSMTDEQLAYARRDANQAREAQRGMPASHGGKDEGYYTDEASTYAQEMRRRETEARGVDWDKETKIRDRALNRIVESGFKGSDIVEITNHVSATDATRAMGSAIESALRGGPIPSRPPDSAYEGMSSYEKRRLETLAKDVWDEVFTAYDSGLDLGKNHTDKVSNAAEGASRAFTRLVLGLDKGRRKEANMEVLKALADELFDEQGVLKAAPPWMDEKEGKAPPAQAAPAAASAPPEGEVDGAPPAEGNAKNDEDKAGATPGGDPTERDPKLGGMLDQLAQGLLAEIEPLKQGGDPTQIATALKTALEKFAASFMQTYAGAPAPQAAAPGAPPAPPKPPAAPAAAPPQAQPPAQQAAPPAGGPPKRDKPPWMKGADTDILKAFSEVDADELRAIVQRATKKNIEDARRHLSGRLPD